MGRCPDAHICVRWMQGKEEIPELKLSVWCSARCVLYDSTILLGGLSPASGRGPASAPPFHPPGPYGWRKAEKAEIGMTDFKRVSSLVIHDGSTFSSRHQQRNRRLHTTTPQPGVELTFGPANAKSASTASRMIAPPIHWIPVRRSSRKMYADVTPNTGMRFRNIPAVVAATERSALT